MGFHRWLARSPTWEKLKPRVRELRQGTPAEQALWYELRDRRCGGLKFRRQHGIDRFLVDFYCAEARLVVEVDGPIHESQERASSDQARDAHLAARGIRVLRIPNEDIARDLAAVLWRIRSLAAPNKARD